MFCMTGKNHSKVKDKMWVFDKPTVTSSKISSSTQGSLSRHLTKIPHSKAEALLLTTTAPKAGVSEPITAQTDLSADNHSFGCIFVELLNISEMCVVKRKNWNIFIISEGITICCHLLFMILFSSVTANVKNTDCTNAGLLRHAWSRPFKR